MDPDAGTQGKLIQLNLDGTNKILEQNLKILNQYMDAALAKKRTSDMQSSK